MDEKYRLKKMADLIKEKDSILDLGCSAIPNPNSLIERLLTLTLNNKSFILSLLPFSKPWCYQTIAVGHKL